MIPVETPEIGIDQLAAAVKGGAAIVDVREPGEYVAGHVPGAVLIPMGQLSGRTAELDRAAGVSAPTLSHHLKVLRQAGLVTAARRGRRIDYTLAPGAAERLRAALPLPVVSPATSRTRRIDHEQAR